MGEAHHYQHQHHHQQPPPTTSSRLGLRASGGEIVEVQGGHIVRSTGRKDRHSKVCTAKGPRDRRVRLSAHTAIQFYDVQDRLGYDRPSKAVDWLIKKAKSAIDELAELPAWKPTTGCSTSNLDANFEEEENQQLGMVDAIVEQNNNQRENNSNFLPPSMDSDSIADTIKSFFPMGAHSQAGSVTHSQAMHYQNFPVPSQDLRLSLQSLQDPMLLHQNQQAHHQSEQAQAQAQAQGLFGYDGSGWSENQRMVSWNGGGDTGAFVFNSPPLLGQTQFFTQRGPLQSSNTPSVRAWMEPSPNDHHHHHQHYQTLPFHPSSMSGIGFAPVGEYSGFRIPARIQGEEEEHGGISDRPSSASSDSRH